MNYRIAAAVAAALILLGLLIWQEQRWRMVDACAKRGGIWDGAHSKCRLVPIRILIEKNLKRT